MEQLPKKRKRLSRGTPDPDLVRTLFVLFPRKMYKSEKEEIKKLHPGIEAVRFKHRARRWCHMKFETEELAKQAAKELHRKKVKFGGRLIVSETKTKEQKESAQKAKKPQFCNLFVTNIPRGITKNDVKEAFKTCRRVCIKPSRRARKKFEAILTMRSFAEAQALFADKESHRINGMPVTVKFSKRVLDLMQGAKNAQEAVNVTGGKELEGVETMNTDRDNIRNDSEIDTGCEENTEKNSHVTQNLQVEIGKPSSSNPLTQETQEVQMKKDEVEDSLDGPVEDDSEDDDDDDMED